MPHRPCTAGLLFASTAFVWGEPGHRIVADIAARGRPADCLHPPV